MDRHLTRIYLYALSTHCRFAFLEISNARYCLDELFKKNQRPTNSLEHPVDQIFSGIHGFIVHAAIISKILWPSAKKKKETRTKFEWRENRGKELRKLLEVDENHPLKNKDFRNFLEHKDEYLDEWAKNSVDKSMIWNCIGSPSSFGGFNDKSDFFTLYDPETYDFIFMSKRYNIQIISDEVEHLYNKVQSILNNNIQ